MLRSVPAVPPGCTSFFVTDSVHPNLLFYKYQTEAMMISQRIGLPTLNGYSGDDPPGWGLSFPNTPTYMEFVRQWAIGNGLTTGICDLDLGKMSWGSPLQFQQP